MQHLGSCESVYIRTVLSGNLQYCDLNLFHFIAAGTPGAHLVHSLLKTSWDSWQLEAGYRAQGVCFVFFFWSLIIFSDTLHFLNSSVSVLDICKIQLRCKLSILHYNMQCQNDTLFYMNSQVNHLWIKQVLSTAQEYWKNVNCY